MDLLQRFAARDKRALARAITLVENGTPEAPIIMREIYPQTGNAHVVGVTGAPGVGKSTLVDRLAGEYRRRNRTVGIIAVDPTSPFTGGAVLGDRIRMQKGAADEGVFIRSLAARGHLGGVSLDTGDVIKVMDAFGLDVIIVETVGAGQSEVDIMGLVHTTLVVTIPGLGDDIQAIKAGILEIGDLFVVNKADRDGAERTAMELETMLDMNPHQGPWRPPVLKTIARDDTGVSELVDGIERHLQHLKTSGRWEAHRLEEASGKIRELVTARIIRDVLGRAKERGDLDRLAEGIAARSIDPYTAADELIERYLGMRAAR